MPEPFSSSPNIEHVIEQDIVRLAERIKEHRELPEADNLTEREIVRQSIQSMTPSSPIPQNVSDAQSPLPAYAQNASPENKLEIEYLLEMAFQKGIAVAAEEASKSSPFVLDAFHDALAGRLYPELQKRGIVK